MCYDDTLYITVLYFCSTLQIISVTHEPTSIGPAFNLFLQETNFYMGPFPVNPLSSPGVSKGTFVLLVMPVLFVLCACSVAMVTVVNPFLPFLL